MSTIVMEALVLPLSATHVRLLVGHCCLEVDTADIDALEELARPSGLLEGRAVAARVTMRSPFQVFHLTDAEPWLAALWKRRAPFVFASRIEKVEMRDPILEHKEAEYFARHGFELPASGDAP